MKNYFKLFVDLFMGVLFVLLMNLSFTGLVFHEIVGTFIFVVFIIHIILNMNWIKAIGKRLTSDKIKTREKVKFLLSVAIFLSVITMGVTGILISKCLFTSITVNNSKIFYPIHKGAAMVSLSLLCVHIGVHLDYLISAVKNIKNGIKEKSGKKAVLQFTLAIIILIALYMPISNYLENSSSNEIAVFDDSNKEQFNPKDERFKSQDEEFKQKPPRREEETIQGDDNNDDNNVITDESGTSDISLQDYLSKLNCNGCGKHCPLSNPRCNKGVMQAEQATEEYNNSNNVSSQNSSEDI
ncbi:MAG: hypothetical protein SOY42_10305 [Clostridium sp.]|nr:hypothetical protein [Clostridium sp.]